MNEIKINKPNKSITFINNGIGFSQFGVADEILDLIINLQEENKELKKKITFNEKSRRKMQQSLMEQIEQLKEEHKNCTRKHWQQKCAEHCANEMIYKSRNEKAIEDIDLVIELIKQQPTEDDTWILNRLNGFKYLLQGEDKQ